MRMRLRRTALINYGNTLPGYAAGEVIVHIKKIYTRACPARCVPRGRTLLRRMIVYVRCDGA